eukprot:TRINITY_DN45068_c0_g1_i1.p3 TRINITY_DN45068_c0_g1~~TRINITY_DN45068_c0_g1_i1.p3  ORF type:complete len:168 (-),score=36.27 TRINITY_DN45068_c0_g1_i1:85-588(-)
METQPKLLPFKKYRCTLIQTQQNQQNLKFKLTELSTKLAMINSQSTSFVERNFDSDEEINSNSIKCNEKFDFIIEDRFQEPSIITVKVSEFLDEIIELNYKNDKNQNSSQWISLDSDKLGPYNKLSQYYSRKIKFSNQSVSYTHLTLPTKRIVQISVVAVSLKKKKK